jgi:serine/threonine protein kinase
MHHEPIDEKAIFNSARRIAAREERVAYLQQVCGHAPEAMQRIAELLRVYDQENSFLESPPFVPGTTIDSLAVAERSGTLIGHYKLLEQIGEGGFGVVFMAEQQQPVRRKVALKVLKPGMDTRQVVARFEAERQALAIMDHPNIARVHDGGATASGRPYFVMELVKGIPITEFCDQNKLTTRQRLELFVPLCQAVQHAHQKGIIHRDLKPSNVLVSVHDTTPVIKVIDFGVAKALGQELTDKTLFTGFAQMIGTPLYMSPEQAGQSGLDIDTRSDIYSLGVLLYELLTGTTPFTHERLGEVGFDELRRIIREEEPPRPSTRISTLGQAASTLSAQRQSDPKKLSQLLRGELDWVVMKCLEKDRNRRYETASALAADVERYLADEAVQACPPTAGYRLRKFLRRNKGPVLAAAVVVLALMGGVVGTTAGLLKAWRERDAKENARKEAAEQADIAAAVNDFLQKYLLRQVSGWQQADWLLEPDPDLKVRTLLDRAAAGIGERFRDKPLVAAAIHRTIGGAYRDVGEYEQAIRHLTAARELFETHRGTDHPDTLAAMDNLAMAYLRDGRIAEARKLYEQVSEQRAQQLGPDHRDTLTTLHDLAWTYLSAGETADAIEQLERLRDRQSENLGPDHPDMLRTLNHLAWAYRTAGRTADAIPLFEHVRERELRQFGPNHPGTLATLNNLAVSYENAGRIADAVALLEQVRERAVKHLGPDDPGTLNTLNNLAQAYQAAGRPAQALPLAEEALKRRRGKFGPLHPETLKAMSILATIYRDAGRPDEALPLLEEALKGRQDKLGRDHPSTLTSMNNLALAYRDAGRGKEALVLLEEAFQLGKSREGPDHPHTLGKMINLAQQYWDAGWQTRAVALLEEARKLSHARSGPDHPQTLAAMARLADAYRATNRLSEALALFEQTAAKQKAKLGPDHPDTLETLRSLASGYSAAGKTTEAISLFEQVRDAQVKKLGPNHPTIQRTLNDLGVAYWRAKQLDKSIPLFEQLLTVQRKKLGEEHPNTLNTLANLGVNYRDAGQLVKAIRTWEQLHHRARTYSFSRGIGDGLLDAYIRVEKTKEASSLVKENIAAARETLAKNSLPLAAALGRNGFALLRLKAWLDAEPILRECLAIREAKEPDAWTTFYTRSMLGKALVGQKKYAEAEPLLLQGYEGLMEREARIPPVVKIRLTEALEGLVELYDAWEKKDKADEWRKKLAARKEADKKKESGEKSRQ